MKINFSKVEFEVIALGMATCLPLLKMQSGRKDGTGKLAREYLPIATGVYEKIMKLLGEDQK